jgi:hypothetical protein
MSQIEWKDFACRSVVVMALAGAIAFGSIDGNAQTAAPQRQQIATVPPAPVLNSEAQPTANLFDDTVKQPKKTKKAKTETFVDFNKPSVGDTGQRQQPAPNYFDQFDKPKAGSNNIDSVPPEPIPPVGLFDDLLKPQSDDDTNRTARITNTSLLGVYGVVAISVLLAWGCAYMLWNLLGKSVQGSSPVATGRRWMNWVAMISCILQLAKFFSQLMNGHSNPGNVLAQGVAGIVGSSVIAFCAGATWAYLRNRKPKDAALRVAPPNGTPDAAHGNSVTPAPVNEPASFAAVPQEEFWSNALAEFDSPERRPGLWARAFAEAQGNEAAAKANYLRYRASELEEAHQLQVAERQRELARDALLTAQGTCPNLRLW